MKNLGRKLTLLFLAVSILASGLVVSAEKADQPVYSAENGSIVASVKAGEEGSTSATVSAGSTSKAVPYSAVKGSLKKASDVNKEAKAWLKVPNTNMNFAIVKPKDNFYYASRTLEGKDYPNNSYKNYADTATYTDYRAHLGSTWGKSSKNIVIYGHNWTNLRAPFAIGNHSNHIMLGQLPSYTSLDFTKANPYIYFSTENMEGIWKVFSVAYIEEDTTIFNYNDPNPNSEKFEGMIKEFKDRSIYAIEVDVKPTDNVITIDTCTRYYSAVSSEQRFVVVARLLRPGESEEDPVTIAANSSVKKPNFLG